MALCPAGHQSETEDYCDVCGEAIVVASGGTEGAAGDAAGQPGSATGSAAAPPPGSASSEPQASSGGGKSCPNCGAVSSGRFCEACGFDSALPPPAVRSPQSTGVSAPAGDAGAAAPEAGWSLIVRADREWYSRALTRTGPDVNSVAFPAYFAERRFRLHGPEMMIGKRDEREGIHPAIDLRVQPEDVGVSRTQAVLRVRSDGGWEVVDIGSTNGTVIGDGSDPVAEFTPVPLEAGDSFHIGAWTTLTLVRD